MGGTYLDKGTMKVAFVLFVLVAIVSASSWYGNDHKRVRLSEIRQLTLYNNKMTKGRRTSPIPQMKCVGGDACSLFQPEVISCKNLGSDGVDAQWRCTTEMDDYFRFGSTTVACEGYDHPDDPFVLGGSCGVEYTLYLTEKGKRWQRTENRRNYPTDKRDTHRNNYNNNNNRDGHRNNYNNNNNRDSNYNQKSYSSRSSSGSSWSWTRLVLFGIIGYFLYTKFLRGQGPLGHAGNGGGGNGGNGGGNSGGGNSGNGGGGGDSKPSTGTNNQRPNNGGNNGGNTGLGFLSGAGLGGALGYMFGRRNNNNNRGYNRGAGFNTGYNRGYSTNTNTYGNGGSSRSDAHASNYSSSNYGSSDDNSNYESSTVREASGHGGTKRR